MATPRSGANYLSNRFSGFRIAGPCTRGVQIIAAQIIPELDFREIGLCDPFISPNIS
jgi:hypothetical protein